jgi:hypothetical protein
MEVQIWHMKDGLGVRIYNVRKLGFTQLKHLKVEDGL